MRPLKPSDSGIRSASNAPRPLSWNTQGLPVDTLPHPAGQDKDPRAQPSRRLSFAGSPHTVKPLDRVKRLVAQDFLTNCIDKLKPDDSLALISGRRAIFERDAAFFRGECPEQIRCIHTRQNFAVFLWIGKNLSPILKALGLLEGYCPGRFARPQAARLHK